MICSSSFARILEHLNNFFSKSFNLRELLFHWFILKVSIDVVFSQKWLTKSLINFAVVCINYGEWEVGGYSHKIVAQLVFVLDLLSHKHSCLRQTALRCRNGRQWFPGSDSFISFIAEGMSLNLLCSHNSHLFWRILIFWKPLAKESCESFCSKWSSGL